MVYRSYELAGLRAMRTNTLIADSLVRLQQQGEIRSFRGKLRWEGNLEAQRLDADPEPGEAADQKLP